MASTQKSWKCAESWFTLEVITRCCPFRCRDRVTVAVSPFSPLYFFPVKCADSGCGCSARPICIFPLWIVSSVANVVMQSRSLAGSVDTTDEAPCRSYAGPLTPTVRMRMPLPQRPPNDVNAFSINPSIPSKIPGKSTDGKLAKAALVVWSTSLTLSSADNKCGPPRVPPSRTMLSPVGIPRRVAEGDTLSP